MTICTAVIKSVVQRMGHLFVTEATSYPPNIISYSKYNTLTIRMGISGPKSHSSHLIGQRVSMKSCQRLNMLIYQSVCKESVQRSVSFSGSISGQVFVYHLVYQSIAI